ncbi:hypothetical protein B0H14DRAFT_2561471 [Mycena olivaceomarginata]|nr:hypothetical protein B0H14DRAFT_2561471 [Mycena olivaceomarginata]
MHDKLRVLAKGKLGSITTKLTPSMHKGPPGIQPGTVEFKVLNLKAGGAAGPGRVMSAHVGGVRRTRALAAAGGMMTDVSGMAGTPEHVENPRPQTSKCSHLIYCEILHVFLRGFAWFIAWSPRLTVPPTNRRGIEPSMTPLLEGGMWDY